MMQSLPLNSGPQAPQKEESISKPPKRDPAWGIRIPAKPRHRFSCHRLIVIPLTLGSPGSEARGLALLT